MYAVPSSCSQMQLLKLSSRVLGTFYYQHEIFVSVATHLFRGIIIKFRKSLRWGTTTPMKLPEWHHVRQLQPFSGPKHVSVIAFWQMLPFRKAITGSGIALLRQPLPLH